MDPLSRSEKLRITTKQNPPYAPMTCLDTRVQQSGSMGCAESVMLAKLPGGASARDEALLPGLGGRGASTDLKLSKVLLVWQG